MLGAFRKVIHFSVFTNEQKTRCKIQIFTKFIPDQIFSSRNEMKSKFKAKYNFAYRLVGRFLQGERVREEGISKSLAVPFIQGWRWGSSSREGHNLRHHDGSSGSGDGSGATRLEGLDG